MKTVTLVCDVCGKEFEKPKKEYNRRIRLGKTEFFCGASCSGKRPSQVEHLRKLERKFPIWEEINRYKGDIFSPYREIFRRLFITRRVKKEVNIDLPYLKKLWEDQNGTCPFTNWKLELPYQGKGYKLSNKTASLDRIDNRYGYIEGNVRFVSVMYNFARNKFSDEEVIEFAKAISKNHEQ